jgi:hypothetical protein
MRRSCQFCRSRKTRCSGDLICTACRVRNISCLYGRESHKGRPRNSISGNGQVGRPFATKINRAATPETGASSNSSEHALYLPTSARISQEDLSVPTDNQQTSRNGVASTNTDSEGSLIEEQSQIRTGLERCFNETFTLSFDSRRGVATTSPVKPTPLPRQDISTLIQGLLEQSVRRFGCLITQNVDDSPTVMSTWFQEILVGQAPGNFNPPDHAAPLAQDLRLLGQYNTHHVSQLLELWFQHHPLSLTVSKTLILHSYRHDTHDHALVAVMLAYSLHALDSQNANTALELYQSAFRQIWSRTAAKSLPTAQILLLLGWHCIKQGDLRQGYCFVSLARTLITEFYTVDSTIKSERINGVEVGNVEQEVAQNIYWIATSITLWMAMHLQLSFQDPSPNPVPFPCSNDSSSAVMQLDKASANYAGLVMRGRLMRQLWALAHITNVVAAIYILHPRTQTSFQTSGTEDWQADIARRLQSIPQQPPDVRALYENIRKVLADGMLVVEREKGGNPGGILVISAFHILSTNLLFPRDVRADEGYISEKFANEILESISRFECLLLAYEHAASGSADKVLDENSLLLSDCAAVLTMALDTCSRSLNRLYDRCVVRGGGEITLLLIRKAKILKSITLLLESCSDANLRTAGVGEVSLSEVKVRFEVVRDKISGMEVDSLGSQLVSAGNFLTAGYPDPNRKTGWNPPPSQALLDENGGSGWDPPSLQTMVSFEKPQDTFGDSQHGFLGDDQAFIDDSAIDWSYLT